MTFLAGIDIGGTKCAVCVGHLTGTGVTVLEKQRFPTPDSPAATLAQCTERLAGMTSAETPVRAIGISCGGPLDSREGLILSPPNLPGWDRVDVVTPFYQRFDVPVALQNDANACALAEWRWGAGQGCRNIIFLTFGTGMGAGLILDGRLYSGTNDLGGEVGHIRLAEDGPVGYGKAGSFEGFCSGGGIARLAQARARAAIREESPPSFCPSEADLPGITAESVGRAAQRGDPLAVEIYETVGHYLGRGLAVLVDILNPERIIIGSIYPRQRSLLESVMMRVLRDDALPGALARCEIVPAGLGEQVGDLASLAVAHMALAGEGDVVDGD
ncbi:MAG: ROK family protein [Anaerolineae bacterium]|nr:ROK family protein [Anaerolineae bacterium]